MAKRRVARLKGRSVVAILLVAFVAVAAAVIWRRSYGYAPGYDAYASAPGYRVHRRGYRHVETQSAPRHYDPGAGYNSNTLAPWQDWKYQGHDY